MPAYIMLANWTDQGAQKVKDSPRRLETAKKALFDMGGEFKAVYMTLGEYDLVVIYEAPDDAVAARFSLMLGMLGSVRTTTMKALPEAASKAVINIKFQNPETSGISIEVVSSPAAGAYDIKVTK